MKPATRVRDCASASARHGHNRRLSTCERQPAKRADEAVLPARQQLQQPPAQPRVLTGSNAELLTAHVNRGGGAARVGGAGAPPGLHDLQAPPGPVPPSLQEEAHPVARPCTSTALSARERARVHARVHARARGPDTQPHSLVVVPTTVDELLNHLTLSRSPRWSLPTPPARPTRPTATR